MTDIVERLRDNPNWPLPSFDAKDWAEAFCKIANDMGFRDVDGKPIDEGWMISWFANALMRGFDEHARRSSPVDMTDIVERLRGYNPPDRTVDDQRQIAADIQEAADEIERLRKIIGLAHKVMEAKDDAIRNAIETRR